MALEKDQQNVNLKQPASLVTRALQGAGIGAIFIGLTYFLGMNEAQHDLKGLLLPLLLVPAAGALGGLVYYATDPLRAQGGPRKKLANVISGLAYLLLITLALQLALNGLP